MAVTGTPGADNEQSLGVHSSSDPSFERVKDEGSAWH